MNFGLNIEGFELLKVIGRGGMGTVYEARQKRPDRLVALKVIHSHLADDPAFKARFQSEMKVAVELEHPNLVPVLDAGESDGDLFMAFRLIKGRDLRKMIKADGPMEPQRAVAIIRQLSNALEYVHSRGFLHRDVKPSNLILDQHNDHLYLSDFGIAKAKGASQALTGTENLIGDLAYMAPEQFGSGDLDERVDVYAEGCVLFELLTGTTPYKDGSLAAVMRAKLDTEPRSLSELGVSVGSQLDSVVSNALKRDRDERYRTPGELGAAASAALVGEAATRPFVRAAFKTGPESASTRIMARDQDDGTLIQPIQATRNWVRPAVIGLISVCFLLIAGVGVSRVGSDDNAYRSSSDSTPSAAGSPDAPRNEPGGETNANKAPNDWEPVSTTLVDARIPAGWKPVRIDERNSNRLTSEWRSPDDPDVTVLIDAQSPTPDVSVMTSARQVRSQTSKSDGYSDISLASETLGSHEAARWEFHIPSEGQKVDYFLQDCNVGVAVLGTAPPQVFDDYTGAFRGVAESVKMNCQKLSASSPITTEGIGPILAGMTKREAEAAGGIRLKSDGYATGTCRYLRTNALKDVGFMFNNGTFARVDVMNPDVSTLSGISVGASEDDVFDAYGANIEEEPNIYDPKRSSYLTFVPEDSSDKHRVLFDVRDGEVVNIRAGRLPEIDYVEGCA